jgi:hypothetical protein
MQETDAIIAGITDAPARMAAALNSGVASRKGTVEFF